jgi:NAD(P)-dependent dehydrogenase (short-subunit alcohol dehydrogenase family)
VVIEGDSGIGFATARHARAEGADVIITARDPKRLRQAGDELAARSTSAFDPTDTTQLEAFFDGLPVPIDHLMLTGGDLYHARLAELDFDEARRDVDAQVWLALRVASLAAEKIRSGGTLLFIGGTGDRRPGVGRAVAATTTAGLPALTRNLALELAPVRVNLIAAGFVDTPLAAAALGDR